ncbi:MAG: isoleucine--tRNA ligase [Gammaproteobacteria bacterium]
MTDYKDTLNLPKTGFPMKANLAQREPLMLKRWQEMDLYGQLRAERQGKDKFIFHDGPPYANGDIHIGHAYGKVLRDIVVKARSLNGFDAPFIPGWDCHGLPIELNVEKKYGKAGLKLSIAEFRTACRKYAQTQIDKQRESFKRLGVLADWDNPYLTMNYQYEADIIRSFARVIANGHLQRGFKPVHWCVDCGSALAEAEVEYKDKQSPAIDVRFPVLDEAAFVARCRHSHEGSGEGQISVPIWTTTPWSLPANQAVALHPELEYALIQAKTEQGVERLLIAEALLTDVLVRYGINDYRVVAYCKGDELEGIKLHHPFYDREVPIVLGEHVTVDAGTGAVHTAPGHGQDDYVLGKEYKLPIDNPVGDNGCFLPNTPLFAGEYVFAANDKIIDVLKANGMLLHEEVIVHSYPHCWRHKTPLIFRATPQWFISMTQNNLRDMAIDAIEEVQWLPAWGKESITDMVTNRPDWCVSRQRIWGVPIAMFIHKETGELHPDNLNLMEKVAQLVEKNGIEIWDELDSVELLGDEAEQYKKVTDVLDVWFDSGVSHECVVSKNPALQYPSDLYLEGADQYRGWFQSSLLTACAMNKGAPYKTVLRHGMTVDEHGHKMSKSLGNVVDPNKVMKTAGADILRLWASSIDYAGEIPISDEIFKRTSDVYRRIRNTAKFLLSNINDFVPSKDLLPAKKMLALDRWAVDQARLVQAEIIDCYNNYQFKAIYQKIHHFCSIEMGSFYLDIIKDRQYTTKKNSIARRSAQTAMYHIIEALARWIAPILSFTADEIWQFIPGERSESVFFATWHQDLAVLSDKDKMNQAFWQQMMQVRDAVNKEIERLRADNVLGSALEAEVILYVDDELHNVLHLLEDELRFVLITSSAQLEPLKNAGDDAVETDLEGLKLKVTASEQPKCIRCWHRRKDVGSNSEHPQICARCAENVAGQGEIRKFA